jgi:penicillin-binding protein 1A
MNDTPENPSDHPPERPDYVEKPRSSGGFFRGVFKSITVVVVFAVIAGVVSGGVFLVMILRGLPDVSKLKEFRHPHASLVYSADEQIIGEFTTERRYPVEFEKIPKHVIDAFVAAEDSNFFEHHGIDWTGVARAIVSNIARGKYAQGGSTITQQVARALLLASKKKEITRKIREMVLSMRMERQLSKNEIMALYLAEIYLGHGSFGIGAAAKNYFNKNVEDLSVAEAALLAGLPQRPNDWNPFNNPASAKRRQRYVLGRMVEEKHIEPAVADAAYLEPIRLYERQDLNNKVAPFFVEHIRQYLMGKYGSEAILTKGFKIHTTLNLRYQKQAEKAVIAGLREVDKRLGWRGVTEKVAEADWAATREKLHAEVMRKISSVRLLPAGPEAEATGFALLFDEEGTKAASPGTYVGETPVKVGEIYRFLVTALSEDGKEVSGFLGRTPARMPVANAAWVRVNDRPIDTFRGTLAPGDVVDAKVMSVGPGNEPVLALEQWPEIQGALLSFELSSGNVLAMVGGTDFEQNKFNCALHAKRQVGSTFKPLLYAAALDKGYSPSTLVTDAPIVFKYEGKLDADNAGEDWRPNNYGGSFEGEIPLRLALIRSMNIPSVKLLSEITIPYAIEYARQLGITAPLQQDLSIALGSWSSSLEELTRAFAVFPRLGRPITLRYLRKVVDGDGNVIEENPVIPVQLPAIGSGDGVVAEVTPLPNGKEVISPQTAYVMTDMLKAVVREGTGRAAAVVPGAVAGKTGTSNDHRDAWFIGYTPTVMTGVWVGYEKNKPLTAGETGGRAAAPIWAEYMLTVSADYPKSDFPIAEDVVFAYVDRRTGRRSNAPDKVRVAFKAGTVPNDSGDNVRHIGEPGMARATSTDTLDGTGAPTVPVSPGPTTPKASEGEFFRQGFED